MAKKKIYLNHPETKRFTSVSINLTLFNLLKSHLLENGLADDDAEAIRWFKDRLQENQPFNSEKAFNIALSTLLNKTVQQINEYSKQ